MELLLNQLLAKRRSAYWLLMYNKILTGSNEQWRSLWGKNIKSKPGKLCRSVGASGHKPSPSDPETIQSECNVGPM